MEIIILLSTSLTALCANTAISPTQMFVLHAGSGYNYGDQLLFDDISSSDGDTKTIVPLTLMETGAAQYKRLGTSVEGTYQNLIKEFWYGTGASFDVC